MTVLELRDLLNDFISEGKEDYIILDQKQEVINNFSFLEGTINIFDGTGEHNIIELMP